MNLSFRRRVLLAIGSGGRLLVVMLTFMESFVPVVITLARTVPIRAIAKRNAASEIMAKFEILPLLANFDGCNNLNSIS